MKNFDQFFIITDDRNNTSYLNAFCLSIDSAYAGKQLLLKQSDNFALMHNIHIEHLCEEV